MIGSVWQDRELRWSRARRTVIAISQGRKACASRSVGSARTTCSIVSWTTSSTSGPPSRARRTRLYTSGRESSTSVATAARSPRRAASTNDASGCRPAPRRPEPRARRRGRGRCGRGSGASSHPTAGRRTVTVVTPEKRGAIRRGPATGTAHSGGSGIRYPVPGPPDRDRPARRDRGFLRHLRTRGTPTGRSRCSVSPVVGTDVDSCGSGGRLRNSAPAAPGGRGRRHRRDGRGAARGRAGSTTTRAAAGAALPRGHRRAMGRPLTWRFLWTDAGWSVSPRVSTPLRPTASRPCRHG